MWISSAVFVHYKSINNIVTNNSVQLIKKYRYAWKKCITGLIPRSCFHSLQKISKLGHCACGDHTKLVWQNGGKWWLCRLMRYIFMAKNTITDRILCNGMLNYTLDLWILNLKYENAKDCREFVIHFEFFVSGPVFTMYRDDATGV